MQFSKVLLLLSAALLTHAEPPVVRDSEFSGYEPAISRQPPSELYETSARSSAVPSLSYLPQSYSAPSQQYGTPTQLNSYPSSPNQRNSAPSELYGTPHQRSGQQFSSHHNQGHTSFERSSSSHTYAPSNFRSVQSQEYGAPLQRNAISQQYGVPNQRTAPSNQYGVPTSRNSPSQAYGTPSLRYSPSEYHSSSASTQRNSLNQHYGAPSFGQQAQRFANSGHISQKQELSQSYGVPNQRSSPSQGYAAPGISVPFQQFGVASARHGSPSQEYGVPSNQYLPAARSGEGYDDENSNEPVSYEFAYAVKEDESGNDFEHRESRNDEKTFGSYSVTLPDGIKQTVEYEADENGFRPRITTEDTGNVYKGRSGGYENSASGYDANSQNYSGNDDTVVVVARTQSKTNGEY